MRNKRVMSMVLVSMFIAMVTITTYIGVPWPFAAGGYMHLGTLTALIIALAFGKKYGAISSGVGMAIFDFFSPYAVWTLGTLVVRFAMGYVVGTVAHNNKTGEQGTNVLRNIVAIALGAVVMIVGYYLFEAIFLTDFRTALVSITGNVIQFTLGLLSLLIVPAINVIQKEMLDNVDL